MAGYGVRKVFDFEGSLEATGKETAERPDERPEGREEDAVDLEGVQVHRFPSECVLYHSGQSVLVHHKDIRRLTFNSKPIGIAVEAHGTHKILELRQEVGQNEAKDHSGEETSNEALPGLLG